ncbi:phospholipid carrier-dependent glycosyltransferase [Oscillatoria sp. FACHB-1406]|uniref:phospholipid carrier-dependent glycosyltransferase n=1 Tax=Oscillatoria sp. FACHB-1406 TaxID=2692846 RepID=UPI001689D0F3|nr:phospholipid carrier-dependent glycosyltransferase [Oscillatoria sp. FACHB-1406]MBD2576567.1 phospholipid carrier-dependent glycosyltransferase [Oscillatoria sp. FACHB-1406]
MQRDGWILAGIWLEIALCDRIWLKCDRAIPAWDQTNHLTGTLNYLNAFQHAQWFSLNWWRSLWMLSSKNPPLPYIATAPFQQLFGRGQDSAMLVMLLWSALLLACTYALGKYLFNRQVGLIAACMVAIMPAMYLNRLQYLVDYPLAALVTASFYCLTRWQTVSNPSPPPPVSPSPRLPLPPSLLNALGFGFFLGLAMLTKQSVIFFLFVPSVWVVAQNLWRRAWGRLLQLLLAFILAGAIAFPWYSTNWIYFIGNFQSGIASAAVREGDPPLNTLAAWTYYFKLFPAAFSWPLSIVPIVALLLAAGRKFIAARSRRDSLRGAHPSLVSLRWLALFIASSYLLCSALVNKDARYIVPMLPALAVVLAWGLTLLPKRWGGARWGVLGLGALLAILNLFPLGGAAIGSGLRAFSLSNPSYPYTGIDLPQQAIVAEIIRTTPQLQATVGVMPVTPPFNHNNFNYYGALANFQVYGREVGVRDRRVERDLRSLDWFITKNGDLGTDKPSTLELVRRVESSNDFKLQKTWQLPDGSLTKLYHRLVPSVQVRTLSGEILRVRLDSAIAPAVVPPGQPVPVTYTWSGGLQQLRSGIVLLSWQPTFAPNSGGWIHDRAIGNGQLFSGNLTAAQQQQSFEVVERTAMLPPTSLAPGTYRLEATYLNRETGERYPIAVPSVNIRVDSNAPPTPAPELDLVTQLRNLAQKLPQGITALDPVFDDIGRINQYDPVQDYTQQAEISLKARLQQDPNNGEWAYALALSQVLQEDAEGAIAALQNVVRLDPQNPYAHAYLAFVYLYSWRGKAAQNALKPAIVLQPNSLEIQALNGVSALMQGHLIEAWQTWEKIGNRIKKI